MVFLFYIQLRLFFVFFRVSTLKASKFCELLTVFRIFRAFFVFRKIALCMFLRDATMLNDIQGTLRDSIESNMLVIILCPGTPHRSVKRTI
jgi:hypothetical protein